MRLYRGLTAGLTGVGVLLLATTAFAQEAEVGLEAEVEADAEGADAEAETEADAEPMEEEAPAEPEPMAMEQDEAMEEEPMAEEPMAEEPVAEEAPAEEAPAEEPGGLSWMMFGDAYATIQTSQPGTPSPGHRAYASNSPSYTAEDGFSLSFIGLDVAYEGENFGVTTSLRFGPSVPIFYAQEPVLGGIGSIVQGYVTWAPTDSIALDFGQFGTIFGAEVAESWANLNYTRGALYYLMQPFWHTGLRGSFALSDNVTLVGMVVNDANQISLDPGSDLQAALQAQLSFGDFFLALGTLQTLGDDNGFIDRFFDIVATYSTGGFSLVFNGDLNIDDSGEAASFWGVSLAAGYAFSDMFGVALRGELLDPSMEADDDFLVTGTLTLDLKPVPDVENVVLRWDNRIESAPVGTFTDRDGAPTDIWFASTIGLAVHTDGLL